MGWLRLVGSLKSKVSFAKEPDKRDEILKKRPLILRQSRPKEVSGGFTESKGLYLQGDKK